MQAEPMINPEDVYVLLQGPAHIKPVGQDKLELNFLYQDGSHKNTLFFTLDTNAGAGVFKVASLDLIIEIKKVDLEELKANNAIKDYFPDTYYVIEDKDADRHEHIMNPPDPPIRR